MPPTVFADTFYWLALAWPRDPWHAAVQQWTLTRAQTRIVTTDDVFAEFLNAMSRSGVHGRAHAAATVHDARRNRMVQVVPQTRAGFDSALSLYESRLDKEYSLTDCRSMVVMSSLGLSEVLTNDHHFIQEGFTVLFP
jgi:predicted nucleic acid-binding protein